MTSQCKIRDKFTVTCDMPYNDTKMTCFQRFLSKMVVYPSELSSFREETAQDNVRVLLGYEKTKRNEESAK